MKKISLLFLMVLSVLCMNCTGQNSEITDFTINKKEFKLSDFKKTSTISYMPYGNDEETLKQKGLEVFKIEKPEKICLLDVKGTLLYVTANKNKIQDYWLRIEGVENVKKLYSKLYKIYPKMTSYQDGTLRFKQFGNNNEVLEVSINNLMPSDVFMDVCFTNNYENTSLNMYKNYDAAIDVKLKKAEFKYNAERKIYEIKKVDSE